VDEWVSLLFVASVPLFMPTERKRWRKMLHFPGEVVRERKVMCVSSSLSLFFIFTHTHTCTHTSLGRGACV
jgi:hypothetical protein